MKKIFLFLMMSLVCGATLLAQDDNNQRQGRGPRGPRMDPKERVEQQIKELGLNDTQAEQFRVVMEEQQKQMEEEMKAMFEQNNGERPTREQMEANRAKMQEKQEAINVVLQLILTEEQFKKYQEMNQRRGPGGRGGFPGGGPQNQNGEQGGFPPQNQN